jgi:hypothetical protein
MMRSVMTSRLEDGTGARRETAVVWAVTARVVGAEAEAEFVETDFVVDFDFDFDFEFEFEERFVRDLVLKGFAMGARLREPSGFFAGVVGAGYFFVLVAAVSVALDSRLQEAAKRRSAVMRRRSNIYWPPVGLVV